MADWPWQTAWEEFDGGSKAHIYGMFPGYFLSAYVLGVRLGWPGLDEALAHRAAAGRSDLGEGRGGHRVRPGAGFVESRG